MKIIMKIKLNKIDKINSHGKKIAILIISKSNDFVSKTILQENVDTDEIIITKENIFTELHLTNNKTCFIISDIVLNLKRFFGRIRTSYFFEKIVIDNNYCDGINIFNELVYNICIPDFDYNPKQCFRMS